MVKINYPYFSKTYGLPEDRMSLHEKPAGTTREARLVPEPYSEENASREIRITEKELNALIAKDEEAARRVAVDLSDDLVSIKVSECQQDYPETADKDCFRGRHHLKIYLPYAKPHKIENPGHKSFSFHMLLLIIILALLKVSGQ
jgi:hypothetical protein